MYRCPFGREEEAKGVDEDDMMNTPVGRQEEWKLQSITHFVKYDNSNTKIPQFNLYQLFHLNIDAIQQAHNSSN